MGFLLFANANVVIPFFAPDEETPMPITQRIAEIEQSRASISQVAAEPAPREKIIPGEIERPKPPPAAAPPPAPPRAVEAGKEEGSGFYVAMIALTIGAATLLGSVFRKKRR